MDPLCLVNRRLGMSSYLIKAGIFLLAANVFYLLIDTFWFEEKSLFSNYIDDVFYVSLAFIGGGLDIEKMMQVVDPKLYRQRR